MASAAIDSLLKAVIDEHRATVDALAAAISPEFAELCAAAVQCLQQGGKLMLFGNGGSAAEAQHIATELTVRFRHDRQALAAIALTTDGSALTAGGNDLGFERIFSRQIEAIAKPGDVAIGISTIGTSANVLAGLKAARARDCVAAGLSGRSGGRMVGLAAPLLRVPSEVPARIQEMHILIGHLLCAAIEDRLGLAGADRA